MTKEEVQQNIRYNENLVNQYQRKLNSLNQQLDSLDATMRRLDSQYNELLSKKRKLEDELYELEQLRRKVSRLQDDFASRQAKRVNGYNRNTAQIFTTNFFVSYIRGMQTLLSGSEYRNAYNGLTSALCKIESKQKSIQREIDSVVSQINGVRNRIDSTNREINSCRTNISQTNSDGLTGDGESNIGEISSGMLHKMMVVRRNRYGK